MNNLVLGTILAIFFISTDANPDFRWIVKEIENLKNENSELRNEVKSLKSQAQCKKCTSFI